MEIRPQNLTICIGMRAYTYNMASEIKFVKLFYSDTSHHVFLYYKQMK